MNQFERQLADLNRTLAQANGAPPQMAKALAPAATKAAPAGSEMSGSEFMAKALTAHAAGYISSAQLTECELCINNQQRPPEPILRAVVDGRVYSPWG